MSKTISNLLTEVNTPKPVEPEKLPTIKKRKRSVECFIIVLDDKILISQLEEVPPEEDGQPNCRLIEPFVIVNATNAILEPYLIEYTNDNKFMLHSSKIFTLAKPNNILAEKYQAMLG